MIYVNIIISSIQNLLDNLKNDYINTMTYPVNATEYIIGNIETKKMRIYNHFNFGSYLELKGIKAFIDSRSGIFTEEFNPGITVFSDWAELDEGEIHYREIFDKYNITHALLYNNEIISIYIKDDPNWNLIYQDDSFVLYERIKE